MSKAKVAKVEKSLGMMSAVSAAHDWAATPIFEVEMGDESVAQITPYGVVVGVTAAAAVALAVKAAVTAVF